MAPPCRSKANHPTPSCVGATTPRTRSVETPSGTLFVDGGSLLYLIGSVMDWVEDDFTAGFVFNNPNAKGSCGCGESFTI